MCWQCARIIPETEAVSILRKHLEHLDETPDRQCGHEQPENTECKECRKEAEHRQAELAELAFGWPEIETGSPKQIQWARRARWKFGTRYVNKFLNEETIVQELQPYIETLIQGALENWTSAQAWIGWDTSRRNCGTNEELLTMFARINAGTLTRTADVQRREIPATPERIIAGALADSTEQEEIVANLDIIDQSTEIAWALRKNDNMSWKQAFQTAALLAR
jgi:hypothetical protein